MKVSLDLTGKKILITARGNSFYYRGMFGRATKVSRNTIKKEMPKVGKVGKVKNVK